MPAVIFSGSQVKALKDQLDLNGTAKVLTGTDDPTSVAKDAETGSLYLRQGGGGQVYVKNDNGSSTNWTLLAAGSSAVAETVVPKTATATLTAGEVDGSSLITNDGASGDIILTLPAASGSEKVIVMVTDPHAVTIQADTGDNIRLADNDVGNPTSIKSDAQYSCVQLHAIDSTTWQAAFDEGAWISADQQIFAATGTDGTSNLNINESYDASTDAWASESVSGMDPGNNTPKVSIKSTKEVYAYTGNRTGAGNFASLNQRYTVLTDTWDNRAAVPTGGNNHGGADVGLLFYASGGDFLSSTTHEYNSGTNAWTVKANNNDDFSDAGGNAASDGTDVWWFGGSPVATPGLIQEYTVGTNSFTTQSATLSVARIYPSLVGNGTEAYCFGGEDTGTQFDDIDKYVFATDTITTFTSTLVGNRRAAGADMIRSLAYVSGGATPSTTVFATNESFDPVGDSTTSLTAKTTASRDHYSKAA